jgi:hypothetical protein
VALAAREQFQPVLALEGQPFELPHLPRKRRFVKLVFDVQSEPFTRVWSLGYAGNSRPVL